MPTRLRHFYLQVLHMPIAKPPCAKPPSAKPPCAKPPCVKPPFAKPPYFWGNCMRGLPYSLSDKTRNFIRDRYRDFFLRPNILETDTETCFRYQMCSRPISRLFLRPNTFRDRYWDFFFETKFVETDTETLKKMKKVSIPRSLATRCHTLIMVCKNNFLIRAYWNNLV